MAVIKLPYKQPLPAMISLLVIVVIFFFDGTLKKHKTQGRKNKKTIHQFVIVFKNTHSFSLQLNNALTCKGKRRNNV